MHNFHTYFQNLTRECARQAVNTQKVHLLQKSKQKRPIFPKIFAKKHPPPQIQESYGPAYCELAMSLQLSQCATL